ncbi:MAG TPA: hypothetical protein VOA64_11480 [Candidatus Dormibacteraeota bacterium]|nr:hypothetical protein [Candidatus Dormibacteraeota bacterium]
MEATQFALHQGLGLAGKAGEFLMANVIQDEAIRAQSKSGSPMFGSSFLPRSAALPGITKACFSP